MKIYIVCSVGMYSGPIKAFTSQDEANKFCAATLADYNLNSRWELGDRTTFKVIETDLVS